MRIKKEAFIVALLGCLVGGSLFGYLLYKPLVGFLTPVNMKLVTISPGETFALVVRYIFFCGLLAVLFPLALVFRKQSKLSINIWCLVLLTAALIGIVASVLLLKAGIMHATEVLRQSGIGTSSICLRALHAERVPLAGTVFLILVFVFLKLLPKGNKVN